MKKHLKVFLGTFVLANLTLFAGTKALTVIENFSASECPDSVTFTWKARQFENRNVLSVVVQRRLKGATEEEAWEFYGRMTDYGSEAFTVEGFTLDNDYEYRAVAISEVLD